MPKKGEPMSDELKAKLAAGRAAKKAQKQTTPETKEEQPIQAGGVTLSNEQFQELMNRITQAEAAAFRSGATPDQKLEAKAELTGARLGVNGVQGVVQKYNVEASWYPDPSERILNMPELARFAPHQNYEVKWVVDGVEYEKANITYTEPVFKVSILRVMFDDNGMPTNQRAIVGRHIQLEDENVARWVGKEMGLNIEDERAFMDEIRFQRIRRWVLDLLTPQRQQDRVESISEMVIDGRVVPVMEVETNADKAINPNLDMQKLG